MELSFGQWARLGFGFIGLMKKHAAAVPALRALSNDALDLWESVVPPDSQPAADAIPHHEVIEKIRAGDLSAEEKAVMDRASQSFG